VKTPSILCLPTTMAQKQKNKKSKGPEKPPPAPVPLTPPPAPVPLAPPTVIGSKKLKRFYEALVLLYVLGQTRGPQTSSAPVDMQYEENDHNVQRLLVDSLAFYCAYEKGGERVTAMALEKTPTGSVIFWIAANKLNKEKVVPFLEQILNSLAGLDPDADHSALEEKIFEQAVNFGKSRVKAYGKSLESALNACIKVLDNSQGKPDKGE
jgi:hypothetical protein